MMAKANGTKATTPPVRHRPQQAPNALADYIEKASATLQASEAPKPTAKRRRRKPNKQNARLSSSTADRRWVVSVRGMAEPEELEDDDEFADVCTDLAQEFEKFGPIEAFSVAQSSGVVTVEYAEELHAAAAVLAKNNQRYGGRLLAATMEATMTASQQQTLQMASTVPTEKSTVPTKQLPSPPEKPKRRRSKIKNAVAKYREACESNEQSRSLRCSFVVRHMVEAAEVEDGDEYEEVVEEVRQHLGQYGEIAQIGVSRSNGEDGEQEAGDVNVEFADAATARTAFESLKGSLYGGRILSCEWIKNEGCYRVTINGMVEAEELDDDDEFADLCEEIQTYLVGHVCENDGKLDISVSQSSGQVTLSFHSRERAEEVAQRLNYKVYGGRELRVELITETTTVDPSDTAEQELATKPAQDRTSDAMTALLTIFLRRLASLQERAHIQNPMQDKRSRRLVLGLHEVRRGVQSHKIKLLLLAQDFDECDVLDSKLSEIVDIAAREEIPLVRALTRRKIGRILKKNARVSCVGVYSYDGANDLFHDILREVRRMEYTAAIQAAT